MEQNEHNQPGRPLFAGGQSPDGLSGGGFAGSRAPMSLLPAVLRQVGEYQRAAGPLVSADERAADLQSAQWQRRAAALQGLARSRGAEALPLLAAALRDEHPLVRVMAVRALGMAGPFAPLDLLISALNDPAWQVREVAVLTLGRLREQGSAVPVAPLLQALEDQDRMVREAAAIVLRQLQPDREIKEAQREEALAWEQGREYGAERRRPVRPERPRVSRRRLLTGLGLGSAAVLVLGSATGYALISGRLKPAGNHPAPARTATSGATARPTPALDPYNQWAHDQGIMFGFDARHTGFNPFEKVLAPTNVASLTQRWFSHVMQGNVFSTPVVAGGLVYSSSLEGSLYAFDAASGQTRWVTPPAGTSSTSNASTPAVFNGRVYTCLQDRRLYAFDALQGKLQWSSPAGHDMFVSPTVAAGTLYIPSGGRLYAFEASSGRILWISPAMVREDSAASPVAVANNLVYVCLSGTGAGQGKIYAFAASTGVFKWSSEPIDGGVDSNSSPTVQDDLVYIGASNGGLAAFDAHTGKHRWTTPAARGSTGSSPAIANGVAYFSNDHVSAFDASTGRVLWTTPSIGAYNSDSPLVANGVVYVCSAGNNSVYALDASHGRTLWTSPPANNQVFTTPAVADGVVYMSSEDGALYAFALPGSP